jgi:hypothetical protein
MAHPFVSEDIAIYNRILDRHGALRLDDPATPWTEDHYQPGTVHYSEVGHREVARVLVAAVRALAGESGFGARSAGDLIRSIPDALACLDQKSNG